MNTRYLLSLRYLLIMLLVLAPFRSPLAISLQPCEMDDMEMDDMPAAQASHDGHHGHDMSAMSSSAAQAAIITVTTHTGMDDAGTSNIGSRNAVRLSDETSSASAVINHQCCCCDSGSCAGNCDMSISLSLLLQHTSYAPVFVAVTAASPVFTAIASRNLTPPSRPPATVS